MSDYHTVCPTVIDPGGAVRRSRFTVDALCDMMIKRDARKARNGHTARIVYYKDDKGLIGMLDAETAEDVESVRDRVEGAGGKVLRIDEV